MGPLELLRGLIAVQTGFARPFYLFRAFAACKKEGRGLAEVLESAKAITARQRQLLDALVEAALALHGGDAEETLTAFGGRDALRWTLGGGLDLELEPSKEPSPDAETVVVTGESSAGSTAPSVRTLEMEDERGDRVTPAYPGRYTVRRLHGRGGQARVLLAYDEHTGREVAIKELHVAPPAGIPPTQATPIQMSSSTQDVIRFLREARVTAQLEHPNIVPVYELARRPDGTLFYTMRLVRGMTLSEKLKECRDLAGRLKLLGVFWDACKAIAFAHSRGVVHRDIKPKNIMVGEFGETVVLDWGIAKVRGLADIRAPVLEREIKELRSAMGMTAVGIALGTPSYMPPEQARGEIDQIDEQSDVWGLGAMLYEILTGAPPYRGPTSAEVVRRVIQEPMKPIVEACPQVPRELAAITEKALRKQKNERYRSARDLADEIGAYMTGEKVAAYRYSPWEQIRRFVAAHRAAMVTVLLVSIAVVGSVLVSLQVRRMEVKNAIRTEVEHFSLLGKRLEVLEKARTDAFDAFDRDNFLDGETRWRGVVVQTGLLEGEYSEMWSRLQGLLVECPGNKEAVALRVDLLRRLIQVSEYGGKRDLAGYYRRLLLQDDPGGAQRQWLEVPGGVDVLSRPAGASLSLRRMVTGGDGLVAEEPVRDLGEAPVFGVGLEPGSYLIEARLAGREVARVPVLVERGEERVLTIPLPASGEVPAGMVYVPPGEFLTGSSEPEEIRRHSGAVPLHRVYTDALAIARTEVTFEEYLPFLQEQPADRRDRLTVGGPYRLELGAAGEARLTFHGQSRLWGEQFEFKDCADCTAQDWRKWPVAVRREAAEAYAAWRSGKLKAEGKEVALRLPTEREWEHAARGADGRSYPCGEKLPDDAAVSRQTHGLFVGPEQVSSRPKGQSVFGVDDLAGNAWEWVQVTPEEFALKGGSFREGSLLAQSSSRIKGEEVYETHASGFRLAMSLPGNESCPLDAEIPAREPVVVAMARACRDEGFRARARADIQRALSLYLRMLALYQSARGEEHPDTAYAFNLLGLIHKESGSLDLALENHQKALAIRLKVLGPDHADTAFSYNNIGNVYRDKGVLDQSLEFAEKALAIKRKVLGLDHPSTASSYNNIGLIQVEQGSYDQALETLGKSLMIRLKVLGPMHPDTAMSYNNISAVYFEKNDNDQALMNLEKALAVWLKVLVPEHPDIAMSYSNIAEVQLQRGSIDRALEYAGKALAIYLKVLGPNHYKTATAYNGLAEVYLAKGSYDRAQESLEKAQRIQLGVLGVGSPQTARTYRNLGNLWFVRGSLDQALESYRRALEAMEKKFGPDHKDVVALHMDVAEVVRRLGDEEVARQHFEKALANGQKACRDGVAVSCSDLAVVRCSIGLCDQEATALLERALFLAPANADVTEARAFLLLKRGEEQTARREYCRIHSLGALRHPASRERLRQVCPGKGT